MKSTSLKTEPWIAWIIHHFITTTLELEMIQQPNVKNLQMNSQCDADVGKLWGKSEESRGKTWEVLKWCITQTSRVSSNRGNENNQLICMAWTFWGHAETSHFLVEMCLQRSYSDSLFLAPQSVHYDQELKVVPWFVPFLEGSEKYTRSLILIWTVVIVMPSS